MPGRDKLAKELRVHGSTVERALAQLEREGLLEGQGPGKRRRITLAKKKSAPGTTVALVLYERADASNNYILDLQNRLYAAGHTLTFAAKSMRDLKFDPERIEAMVKETRADAFIILAGPRAVLERLSNHSAPVFALFGRMQDLPIAGTGPDKMPALRETIERLYKNKHRRIVMLTRGETDKSKHKVIERVFVEELMKWNIPHGNYNLPEWENSPAGLNQCLTSLFQLTPPSAILVDDWMLMFGVQSFLARTQGRATRTAVCICTDHHPCFNWCQPGVPHFYWDPQAVVQRVYRWVNNIARGRDDRKQSRIRAELVNSHALTVAEGVSPSTSSGQAGEQERTAYNCSHLPAVQSPVASN